MQVARSNLASSSFPSGPASQPQMYNGGPHGALMAAPTYSRSFSDVNGYAQHPMDKPQIYTVRLRFQWLRGISPCT
jgi:hypothetical protein